MRPVIRPRIDRLRAGAGGAVVKKLTPQELIDLMTEGQARAKVDVGKRVAAALEKMQQGAAELNALIDAGLVNVVDLNASGCDCPKCTALRELVTTASTRGTVH